MAQNICVVLGGYVNGYSIIQELRENSVPAIVLIDNKKDVAWGSHLLDDCILIQDFVESKHLLKALIDLHEKYNKLIIYPTKDEHLNALQEIYNQTNKFTIVGFDINTIRDYQSKKVQYGFCKKLNIPYPETIYVKNEKDLENIDTLQYPLLIKPYKSLRDIRNFIVENKVNYIEIIPSLKKYISQGVEFLFSELIQGEGDQIYAYMAYVNKKGHILGEWTGKKLAQFPNNFGVFSSAMAVENSKVMELGRKLVQGMRLTGIVEPEFKYDARDGKYKLMEVNLRSMMWNRVGALNGMPLHYIQYVEATGQSIPNFIFKPTDKHYVYYQYEWLNCLLRKGYSKIFRFNVYGGNSRELALYNKGDVRTFMRGWILLIGKVIKKCRKYIHK